MVVIELTHLPTWLLEPTATKLGEGDAPWVVASGPLHHRRPVAVNVRFFFPSRKLTAREPVTLSGLMGFRPTGWKGRGRGVYECFCSSFFLSVYSLPYYLSFMLYP